MVLPHGDAPAGTVVVLRNHGAGNVNTSHDQSSAPWFRVPYAPESEETMTSKSKSAGERIGQALAVAVMLGALVVTAALTTAAALYALGLVGAAWRSLV